MSTAITSCSASAEADQAAEMARTAAAQQAKAAKQPCEESAETIDPPSTVEIHEAANLFPMMNDREYEDLKADIKKNGIQVRMVLHEGKLLDGRNRYRACVDLDINPNHYIEELYAGSVPDPVAWVLSRNLHRRHLTASQRAMIAAKAVKLYSEEAKERVVSGINQHSPMEKLPQGTTGTARDKAGASVGVSGTSVDHAKKVQAKGTPELIDAVNSGKLAVSKAAKIADLPATEQVKAIEEAVSRKPRGPKANPAPKPPAQPRQAVETADENILRLMPISQQPLGVARGLFDRMNHSQRTQLLTLWSEWLRASAAEPGGRVSQTAVEPYDPQPPVSGKNRSKATGAEVRSDGSCSPRDLFSSLAFLGDDGICDS